MKAYLKEVIKKKIPLSSLNYEIDLDKEYHIIQGSYKSYYKKYLNKLNFNELCILFKTDKGTVYENIIYDNKKKTYTKSLVVGHGYSRFYQKLDRLKIKNIIEIGSYRGSSAAVFSVFFNKAKIFCLDINFSLNKLKSKRALRHYVDQSNKDQLKKFINKTKIKNKIDLISDDGAHYDKHILNSFDVLFKSLKSGGYYFIEDVALERTPKTFKIFKFLSMNKKVNGFNKEIFNKIKYVKFEKSLLNKKVLSNSNQDYLVIIKKK